MKFRRGSCKLRRGHHQTGWLDFETLEFERIEKADFLRYSLATAVLSIGNVNRLSKSLFGLIPDNSLLDKCPYYRWVVHVGFCFLVGLSLRGEFMGSSSSCRRFGRRRSTMMRSYIYIYIYIYTWVCVCVVRS